MSSRRPVDVPTTALPGSAALAAWRRRVLRSADKLDRDLPWSRGRDPWAILVSEIMLQQTSVARVLEPWRRFMEKFPTPAKCANASLSDTLRAWEGLGYHRRARALHQTARVIRDDFGGDVPRDVNDLLTLPGVGPYTARAVASFAYGSPVGVVDTNVGRLLARAIVRRPLSPREAQTLVDALVDQKNSGRFNQALLDLGATFCRAAPLCVNCPVRASCRWRREGGPDPAMGSAGVSRPQPAFAGSDRQARGALLATLRRREVPLVAALRALDAKDDLRATRLLESLVRDGLVEADAHRVALAES